MPVFTLAAQNAVSVSQLGVVTSLTQFARSMGSTIGVAVFGSVLTSQFSPAFHASLSAEVVNTVPQAILARFDNPQILVSPEVAATLRDQVIAMGSEGGRLYDALFAAIRAGLVVALHDVFLLGAVLSVIGVITVLFLKEIPLRKSFAPPSTIESSSDTAAQVGQDAFPSLPPLEPEDPAGTFVA